MLLTCFLINRLNVCNQIHIKLLDWMTVNIEFTAATIVSGSIDAVSISCLGMCTHGLLGGAKLALSMVLPIEMSIDHMHDKWLCLSKVHNWICIDAVMSI